MANHASAKKRARQTLVRTETNKWQRSRARSAIKNLKGAIESKDSAKTSTLFKEVQSLIAKLGRKSALHRNQSSRLISRLAKQAQAIK